MDKVDQFSSFLLELAHAEDAGAIALHVGDCRVDDICRRDNR